jgi:hypothetical protein
MQSIESTSENAGGKNEGKSHDLIENKRRKNVTLLACHDVYENKLVMVISPRYS